MLRMMEVEVGEHFPFLKLMSNLRATAAVDEGVW